MNQSEERKKPARIRRRVLMEDGALKKDESKDKGGIGGKNLGTYEGGNHDQAGRRGIRKKILSWN